MKVQVHNYQNKAQLLIQALKSQGVEVVREGANILLIDFDGPVAGYPMIIREAYEQGAEVVLYSHGAPVITAWDGIWKSGPLVRMYLAQSEGQKQVMEYYGYPVPIKVIGWHYCEQREFQPCPEVKNILFAPEHPHSNGFILPEAKALNKKVYDTLLALPFQPTVRFVRLLSQNGLEEQPGVHYQEADMSLDASIRAIDDTDVVITYPGTFACLAIARGKPVVMYGQDICPHDGYSDTTLKYVKNWDKYRDYMRYGYDISDANAVTTEVVIRAAALQEETEWRNRFIGEQLRPELLLEALKVL